MKRANLPIRQRLQALLKQLLCLFLSLAVLAPLYQVFINSFK